MDPAYLFNTGKNYQAYKFLGAHPYPQAGKSAYVFRVWAPQARAVSLVGDFNDWDTAEQYLERRGETGIWQGLRQDIKPWQRYQYYVHGADGSKVYKADPFSRHQETRPAKASIILGEEDFSWTDGDFRTSRPIAREPQPLNIYELHPGSWRTYEDGNYYNYKEIGKQLAAYCQDMGYNAVEFLPLTEYPLDASWGYQVSSYFAPTSRYGKPQDLKEMINTLHAAGIRVILDWVPAHFPKDAFALYRFDGAPCYEYADSRLAEQESWGTLVFDYSKAEVRSFLFSSAYYWLAEFHFDGLRIDAVTSMLYLDYGRTQALKNRFGGNENLEAINFLRELNELIAVKFPQALLIAEEATAFPQVTQPVEAGGLGFTHKWNMGWMHDSLDFMSTPFTERSARHNLMSFSLTYAFSERYILPFSHDEVVHGKKSLIGRMPGDIWQQCAGLRCLFAWQFAHPGAKLNFMGNDYGQFIEWREYEELEWFMLDYEQHAQILDYNRKLHQLYLEEKALHMDDLSWEGFRWIQVDDSKNSVFALMRRYQKEQILVILNLGIRPLNGYCLNLPHCGELTLLLNSDAACWGGSDYLASRSSATQNLKTRPARERSLKASYTRVQKQIAALYQEAKDVKQAYQGLNQRYSEVYQALAKYRTEGQDTCPEIKLDLPPLPQAQANAAKAVLELDLPPLAALFYKFEIKK